MTESKKTTSYHFKKTTSEKHKQDPAPKKAGPSHDDGGYSDEIKFESSKLTFSAKGRVGIVAATIILLFALYLGLPS